tara:strand:- start:401 stop:1096 length:696 start_codon:yes stop_codon:yes gene_type:complete
MKSIKDVCFVIQTRLGSKRTPRKSIKPFAGTTLFDIAIKKTLKSKIIPKENLFVSIYEKELIDIANKYDVNIYKRSYESANEHGSGSSKLLYEWYNKLPFKYCILLNICHPLLSVETIDNFTKKYLEIESDGLFGVIEKKQYYWDKSGNLITKWIDGFSVMNTNLVEPTYEAAHSLYASRMSTVENEVWMGKAPYTINNPALFTIPEIEAYDIDYPWQFKMAEILYTGNYE